MLAFISDCYNRSIFCLTCFLDNGSAFDSCNGSQDQEEYVEGEAQRDQPYTAVLLEHLQRLLSKLDEGQYNLQKLLG